MRFGISEETVNKIQKVFIGYPEIEKAIIFGSRAMGNYKTGSDVDLAFLGIDVNEDLCIKISAILNERLPLPYHFDIVCYNAIKNPDLKKHIDSEGKVFYQSIRNC